MWETIRDLFRKMHDPEIDEVELFGSRSREEIGEVLTGIMEDVEELGRDIAGTVDEFLDKDK